MPEMAIRFVCPYCEESISVGDWLAREKVECPHCKRSVNAPAKLAYKRLRPLPLPSQNGQYSAEAPSRCQSLSPYTRSPTLTSRAPAPKAAISPENSCPGMTGNGRGSPARVVQVGTHESSVWMTPAAWTRTSTSPSPKRGCGASS